MQAASSTATSEHRQPCLVGLGQRWVRPAGLPAGVSLRRSASWRHTVLAHPPAGAALCRPTLLAPPCAGLPCQLALPCAGSPYRAQRLLAPSHAAASPAGLSRIPCFPPAVLNFGRRTSSATSAWLSWKLTAGRWAGCDSAECSRGGARLGWLWRRCDQQGRWAVGLAPTPK